MTSPAMTAAQALTLARLVAEDGRRFDRMAIHPYSGVMTLSRDYDRTLVAPDGAVTYDSARVDA